MRIFSRYSRKALRLNAGAQIAVECTKNFANVATVPLRISQACVSAVTATKADNHVERAIHALHAIVACAESFLIMTIVLSNQCEDRQTDVCKTALVLELFYQGLLLFSWAHAEINNDNHTETSLDSNILST